MVSIIDSSKAVKVNWRIINKDHFKKFHGKILEQIIHTNLVLILKMKSPVITGDFRLIVCCIVTYKCITKLVCIGLWIGLIDLVGDNWCAWMRISPQCDAFPRVNKRLLSKQKNLKAWEDSFELFGWLDMSMDYQDRLACNIKRGNDALDWSDIAEDQLKELEVCG